MEAVKFKVFDIIAAVFHVERESVTEKSGPDTIESWDSLGHFQLMSALERKFNVRFQVDEISNMDSVSSILDILDNKLAGRPQTQTF